MSLYVVPDPPAAPPEWDGCPVCWPHGCDHDAPTGTEVAAALEVLAELRPRTVEVIRQAVRLLDAGGGDPTIAKAIDAYERRRAANRGAS